MKRLSFLLILLFLLLAGNGAQAQNVVYSPYQKFDHRNGDFDVAGRIGDRIFTYRSSGDNHYLDAWDDSMNLKATVVLDFFPAKVSAVRFVPYADHLSVLYQTTERNRSVLYTALLDAQGLLQGRPMQLEETKTGIFGGSGSFYEAAVSEGKNYILVYRMEESRKEFVMNGWLLNARLEKVKTIKATYKAESSYRRGDVVVTDQGAVYLPVLRIAGVKDYADGGDLLRMDTAARRFTALPLPVDNHYLSTIFMRASGAGNQLVIAGFYSDAKNGQYDGVYFTSFDAATGSLAPIRTWQFDERLRTATGARNLKRAFNDFDMKQLVVRKDGGFVLVAENTIVTTRAAGSPFGFYSYYYTPFGYGATIREYYFNDIVALSFSPTGILEWNSFVRKQQYSQEDGGRFSSFAFLNTGGSLAMLFNDFNTRRSSIQLAAIDASGHQEVRSLAAGQASDPDWLPRFGRQTAQRELIVPCLRRGEICFARVTF